MKTPKSPLSREAKEHFRNKVKRMKGEERKKMEKRLNMYDRGFRGKEDGYTTDGYEGRRRG